MGKVGDFFDNPEAEYALYVGLLEIQTKDIARNTVIDGLADITEELHQIQLNRALKKHILFSEISGRNGGLLHIPKPYEMPRLTPPDKRVVIAGETILPGISKDYLNAGKHLTGVADKITLEGLEKAAKDIDKEIRRQYTEFNPHIQTQAPEAEPLTAEKLLKVFNELEAEKPKFKGRIILVGILSDTLEQTKLLRRLLPKWNTRIDYIIINSVKDIRGREFDRYLNPFGINNKLSQIISDFILMRE